MYVGKTNPAYFFFWLSQRRHLVIYCRNYVGAFLYVAFITKFSSAIMILCAELLTGFNEGYGRIVLQREKENERLKRKLFDGLGPPYPRPSGQICLLSATEAITPPQLHHICSSDTITSGLTEVEPICLCRESKENEERKTS